MIDSGNNAQPEAVDPLEAELFDMIDSDNIDPNEGRDYIAKSLLGDGFKGDSEKARRVSRVSEAVSLPTDLVEQDVASFEAKAKTQEVDVASTPKLAAMIKSPHVAAVVAPDVVQMQSIEKAFTGVDSTSGAATVNKPDVSARVSSLVSELSGSVDTGSAKATQALDDVSARVSSLVSELSGGVDTGSAKATQALDDVSARVSSLVSELSGGVDTGSAKATQFFSDVNESFMNAFKLGEDITGVGADGRAWWELDPTRDFKNLSERWVESWIKRGKIAFQAANDSTAHSDIDPSLFLDFESSKAAAMASNPTWTKEKSVAAQNAFGKEILKTLNESDRKIQSLTPRDLTFLGEALNAGILSTADLAVSAPFGALPVLTGLAGLDQYGKSRKAGESPARSANRASLSMLSSYATEVLPLKYFNDVLSGNTNAVKKFILTDTLGEQVDTALNTVSDLGFGLDVELANAETFQEAVAIQAKRQAFTLVSSSVTSGSVTAVSTPARAYHNAKVRAVESRFRAVDDLQRIDAVINATSDMTIHNEAPTEFKQFTDSLSQEVYITEEGIQELENLGVTIPDAIARVLSESGGATINAETFIKEVVGNEPVLNGLRDHIKLRDSGFTRHELTQRLDETNLKELAENVVKKKAHVASLKKIHARVTNEIMSSEVYNKTVATNVARMYAAFVETKSELLNLTPEEVDKRINVRVLPKGDPVIEDRIQKQLDIKYAKLSPDQKALQKRESLTPTLKGFMAFRTDNSTGEHARAIGFIDGIATRNTSIHEFAHLFLEFERQAAVEFGVTEDHKKTLKWMGIKSGKLEDITTEHHEKFAETFEVYTKIGEAPSPALKSMFRQFAKWLAKFMPRRPRAHFTPEIKGVFDRMLAVDAVIAEVETNPEYAQYFKSGDRAGMSDTTFKSYEKLIAKRKERAAFTAEEKLTKQLTVARRKKWNDERRLIELEVKKTLISEPVFSIRTTLKETGQRLDATLVKEILGETKLKYGLSSVAQYEGKSLLDPELVAEEYGYPTVHAMLIELNDSPTLRQETTRVAEERMVEIHGNPFNEEAVRKEVEAAMSSEVQAEILRSEIKALSPDRNKTNTSLNREDMKRRAAEFIRGFTYSEIKPARYKSAERKFAIKADRARGTPHALKFKEEQLANHYLLMESIRVKAAIGKQLAHVTAVTKRVYNTRQVDKTYVKNMKVYANSLIKPNADIESLLAWHSAQLTEKSVLIKPEFQDVQIRDALEEREAAHKDGRDPVYAIKTVRDMTAAEIEDVYQTLKTLRSLGGQVAALNSKEGKERHDQLIKTALENRSRKSHWKTPEQPQDSDGRSKFFGSYFSQMPHLLNMARKLDGSLGKANGAGAKLWERTIFDAINAGIAKRDTLQREISDKLFAVIRSPYELGITRGRKQPFVKEDGSTIHVTTEAVFMLTLYYGEESSRQRVRENTFAMQGLTDGDMTRLMERLTVDQLEAVNGVWSIVDDLWYHISEASVALRGSAPKKERPVPFTINGVEMSGGHMMLRYVDRPSDVSGATNENLNIESLAPKTLGTFVGRTKSVLTALELNVENINSYIEESVHYAAFAETAREMQSVLGNAEVQDAVRDAQGEAFLNALFDAARHVTSGISDSGWKAEWINSTSRYFRRVAIFRSLMFTLRTPVQGIASLVNIQKDIGGAAWIASAGKLMSDRAGMVAYVHSRSSFMTGYHSSNNSRELREVMNQIVTKGKVDATVRKITKFGFWLDSTVNSSLAYPTWIAKYEKVFATSGNDQFAAREADNAVATSVGSGVDSYLGGLFQSANGEPTKALTFMAGWFNMQYNRYYNATEGGEKFNADAAAEIIMRPMILALMSALLIMDVPDWDDPEAVTAWAVRNYGGFMAGSFMGVRDVVGALNNFHGSTPMTRGTDSIGSAVGTMLNTLSDPSKMDTPILTTLKIASNLIPVAGSGQIIRVMTGVNSYEEGNERGSPVKLGYQFAVKGKE